MIGNDQNKDNKTTDIKNDENVTNDIKLTNVDIIPGRENIELHNVKINQDKTAKNNEETIDERVDVISIELHKTEVENMKTANVEISAAIENIVASDETFITDKKIRQLSEAEITENKNLISKESEDGIIKDTKFTVEIDPIQLLQKMGSSDVIINEDERKDENIRNFETNDKMDIQDMKTGFDNVLIKMTLEDIEKSEDKLKDETVLSLSKLEITETNIALLHDIEESYKINNVIVLENVLWDVVQKTTSDGMVTSEEECKDGKEETYNEPPKFEDKLYFESQIEKVNVSDDGENKIIENAGVIVKDTLEMEITDNEGYTKTNIEADVEEIQSIIMVEIKAVLNYASDFILEANQDSYEGTEARIKEENNFENDNKENIEEDRVETTLADKVVKLGSDIDKKVFGDVNFEKNVQIIDSPVKKTLSNQLSDKEITKPEIESLKTVTNISSLFDASKAKVIDTYSADNDDTDVIVDIPISESKETFEFDHLPKPYQNRKPVSALTPEFTFGYNRYVSIINLSNNKRSFIFYAASHLAIVYDYHHNEQMILQGHCNDITCITASKDKRWLGTGDRGENNVIIIWDCNTGIPVRSMFETYPNGVVSIALTYDARYLATLSAETKQTFAIWNWTTGEDIPLCSSSLSSNYGIQTCISFKEDDYFFVSTNSETRVIFYEWDTNGNMKYFAPILKDQDFGKKVGRYSNTIFIPNSTKAVTATSQGLMVVWENSTHISREYSYDELADLNIPIYRISTESTADKKASKLVPLHNTAITLVTLIDSYIVTGDISGEIKFFDFNLLLIFWYKDWKFGSITSISASNKMCIDSSLPDWKFKFALQKSEYPDMATVPKPKFYVSDFIVGTSTTIFATVTVEGSKIQIIFREHNQSVFSIASHPTLPLVATGSYSGLLKITDYELKRSIKTRFFDNTPIKCLCFDHNGSQLAVGFTNGEVRVLDTHALKDLNKASFHLSVVHVTHIVFSGRSEFMASVDANSTLTLYRVGHSPIEGSWIYVARYRAHYRPVVDIMFTAHVDNEVPRLFTLSKDRRLVEYDIRNATENDLPIAHSLRIEQHSVPLTMCWFPEEIEAGLVLTANDGYKLRMFNRDTKICRSTVLGPYFGSPTKILKVLPISSEHRKLENNFYQRYLAYANHDKIGLIRLPIDGNPYNYMTMIAHPKGITSMCCSFDGKRLISVGEDSIVAVWRVNVDILEAQIRYDGQSMKAFYNLIEGGEFGEFMSEMKDYFYYSMIRTQGIDTLRTRNVDITIEIGEIPDILRAIGFYPSDEEIDNILSELKYRDYHISGKCLVDVDFDSFLKLYINHRPANGISSTLFDESFRNLPNSIGGELPIEKVLGLLMDRGEKIKEKDLTEYLASILGFNKLGGSFEMEDYEENKIVDAVNSTLPKVVTAKVFIEDIICMNICDKESLVAKKVVTVKKSSEETQT